jgi:glucosamine-6-phosphate deaminase
MIHETTLIEKVRLKIFEDSQLACKVVARRIADLIRKSSGRDKKVVLGLATGNAPIGVYKELINLHKTESLDFSNVITFNLDEYWPMQSNRIQSYHHWMKVNFLKFVNIPDGNIYIPSGTIEEDEIERYCNEYERLIVNAGGIDFQILGIGRNGHIGFNEPGSSRHSRTRLVQLDKMTQKDAAGDFFGEKNVPQMAITMGVGTVMEAKEIALLAFGEHKSDIIRRAVEGNVSNEVAASFLQEHPNVMLYLDQASAEKLTRLATPWIVESCCWDDLLERKACIWLANKTEKPIMILTEEDYFENNLGQLIRSRDRAYDINLRVFKSMMNTITGWPGGKEEPKRILILSPHPDDDVICMAGTIKRLVEQGHEVHTAYMVSGYLSVFDHNVLRHAEFVKEFNRVFGLNPDHSSLVEEHIETFLLNKKPTDIDSEEIKAVKTLIRRTEAVAAARFCGVNESNINFLNMPFYGTDLHRRFSIEQKDIEIVCNILELIEPDIIFMAGDLSDPHGTHRLCFEAFEQAYKHYSYSHKFLPEVFLYRGAWQEWQPEQIDLAVPLSPDESRKKRLAIFRHESQKDKAMFPGPYDNREFWQRAEERNMTTASIYNALGLPKYYAIEAFARWPLKYPLQIKSQLSKNHDK